MFEFSRAKTPFPLIDCGFFFELDEMWLRAQAAEQSRGAKRGQWRACVIPLLMTSSYIALLNYYDVIASPMTPFSWCGRCCSVLRWMSWVLSRI